MQKQIVCEGQKKMYVFNILFVSKRHIMCRTVAMKNRKREGMLSNIIMNKK